MSLIHPTDEDQLGSALSVPDETHFRRLVESLSDYAVILLDAQGRVISWNRGAARIKGYTSEEILGQHFSVFYTAEAVAVDHPESELSIAMAKGRYEEEGWRVRKDGTRFWANVTIIAMRDEDGLLEGYGKFTRDLTERKEAEQQATNTLALLRTTVKTDPLTGVLNRRALDETLRATIGQNLPFCVVMLDLDHFKEVNDRLGHATGDRLLRNAAISWGDVLRDGDVLARYGGEEFTVLLPGCNLAEAVATAERMRANTPKDCTCSAGVAAWTPGTSIDQLLGAADSALYQAKNAGRDSVWPQPPFSADAD